jgi:stage II sporulation protein D
VTATGDSLSIVNTVSVEDYVAGVIAGEMPLLWRMDALCAQAVAARSYVLNEKQKWADERPFDVYADERSQVYAGVPNDPKAFQAASDTRGAILVWNWKLFPTFYHSSCAGRTRRAEPFLIARHIPPLAGTTCSWCSDVDTAWRRPIPSAELQKLLNLPKPIDMVALTGDGKIVITSAGSKTNFSPDEFRAFVGPRIIRSPDFTVKKSGNMWHFEGRGFGHGVGMCQHGARGMALKGYKWPSIVRHYYPGAQIVRVY